MTTTPQRIARLEAHVENIRSDISELKTDIKGVDQKLDDLALAIASQTRLPEPPAVPERTSLIPAGSKRYMAAVPFLVALIYGLYEAFTGGAQ